MPEYGDRTEGPRIRPLAPSQWSAPLKLLLAMSPGGTERPLNVFATLAKHPGLFWSWLTFSGKLLTGKLSTRHRELVILRTAYRCGCTYERGHHRTIARSAGFREEELDAIEESPRITNWSDKDSLVLDVVDELHERHRVSDSTWARLERHFDEEQCIELLMLVGNYHLLAFTLNSLRVELEPETAEKKPPRLVSAIQRMILDGKRGRG